MSEELPAALLSQLSEFVAGTMGLHFPRERWRDLERGIRSAARENGSVSAEQYAERLLSAPPDPEAWAALAPWKEGDQEIELIDDQIGRASCRERV